MRKVRAADLFCGAGGTSTGLLLAAKDHNLQVDLLAINHWDVAIATHSKNHPEVEHYCESIEGLSPRKSVPEGHLDILVASPECTHHSNARGGKPMSDQSRASAWHILRWAEALKIDRILIENVREFRDWGPLDAKGRPIARKKGELYQYFLQGLRALGYTVEDRILNAADYGDATCRYRLFIQARRDRHKIKWPEQSHYPPGTLLEGETWRPARDIIDWKLPGRSIFGRKKPLAENTLKRIFAGLQKFSQIPLILPEGVPLQQLVMEPFLVILRNNQDATSIDRPIPTTCAHGSHIGLCEPIILSAGGCEVEAREVSRPLNTVLTRDHMALAEPFVLGVGGPRGTQHPQSVNQPLGTVLTEDRRGVAEPYVIAMEHFHKKNADKTRCYPVSDPLKTITGKGQYGMIVPFILKYYEGSDAASIDQPLDTITANYQHLGLIEPCITEFHDEGLSNRPRVRSVKDPLPTVDCSNRFGLARAYMIPYYGTGAPDSVNDPIATITAKMRHALVETGLIEKGDHAYLLDIRFRMLKPHELAAAHSFPEDYHFEGNQNDKVKQIGNSVPVSLAKALCESLLAY